VVEVIVVVVSVPEVVVEVVVVVGAVLVVVVTVLVVGVGVTSAGPRLAAALNHETKTIPDIINSSNENAVMRKLRLKE
jgi:hypothetical protein